MQIQTPRLPTLTLEMMSKLISIRKSSEANFESLQRLYSRAFPEEDLIPLVKRLLNEPSSVISQSAFIDSDLVGHIAFTRCGVYQKEEHLALLGPIAIDPDCQHQGIGTSLVERGMEEMKELDVCQILVLGDPNYYGRFGFAPEQNIIPPYALPPEWADAWQSKSLSGDPSRLNGTLELPSMWMEETLWIP